MHDTGALSGVVIPHHRAMGRVLGRTTLPGLFENYQHSSALAIVLQNGPTELLCRRAIGSRRSKSGFPPTLSGIDFGKALGVQRVQGIFLADGPLMSSTTDLHISRVSPMGEDLELRFG